MLKLLRCSIILIHQNCATALGTAGGSRTAKQLSSLRFRGHRLLGAFSDVAAGWVAADAAGVLVSSCFNAPFDGTFTLVVQIGLVEDVEAKCEAPVL